MADMKDKKELTQSEAGAPADKKPKSEKKKPNAFVRFFKRIGKFFRDIVSELKKVVWMQKGDVKKNTILVVASVVVFAAVIFVIDIAGGSLIELIAGLIR